jgi:intracellular multiplication protein IcmE
MADDVNDDGLELDEASFDDFEKKKGTLGELWRENAMVKVGVVVAAAVAIFATIILFGGKDMPIDPSYVSGGSDISAPPGTEETSPSYVAAIEEENEARTEQAIKESGSVLPTPIDPPVGRLTVTENEAPEEDPLQRWRKLQEERLQREMLRSQTVAPDADADAARGEAIQALAEAMATQMQSILEKRAAVKPLQYRGMTSDDWLNELNAQREEEAEEAGGGNGNDEAEENIEIVLYPAGRIAYAQILTEANSDVPGPVLAQIASGPLSGSRVLGSFSKQKELLTIKFQTVIVDGVSIDIDAVAVDPKTTLPALATDVDHHYLMRVALPMAAAFVEGLASAISESGLTTVTVEGDVVAEESEDTSTEQDVASGIEEAGQKLREILDETADEIEVTVRVEAGTPVGILFLEPVIKPAEI